MYTEYQRVDYREEKCLKMLQYDFMAHFITRLIKLNSKGFQRFSTFTNVFKSCLNLPNVTLKAISFSNKQKNPLQNKNFEWWREKVNENESSAWRWKKSVDSRSIWMHASIKLTITIRHTHNVKVWHTQKNCLLYKKKSICFTIAIGVDLHIRNNTNSCVYIYSWEYCRVWG